MIPYHLVFSEQIFIRFSITITVLITIVVLLKKGVAFDVKFRIFLAETLMLIVAELNSPLVCFIVFPLLCIVVYLLLCYFSNLSVFQ